MRLLILLAMMSTALAAPKREQRIVGGESTAIENYPYMSYMEQYMYTSYYMTICGGSLITSTTILSAAFCYDGTSPSEWRVRLGSSKASSGGSLHYIARFLIHEAYTGHLSRENDVAIVTLATPAIFSESVGVARIAGSNFKLPAGTPVTTVGWGALEFEGEESEQLHHVEIFLIDQEVCVKKYADLKGLSGYEYYPTVTDGMICSGILDVGGKDACEGDFGGPLVHQGNVVVGITSWGFECADIRYPRVNVRVSYYADWIVANGSF